MITADTLDATRTTDRTALDAAREALGAALAEAFRPEREANLARRAAQAKADTSTSQAAPTFLRLNRHERRRLAALARKH